MRETQPNYNLSKGLKKFGMLMTVVEFAKENFPLLQFEETLDEQIDLLNKKIYDFSGEFGSEKKYKPFTDFLEDYFLDKSIKIKENWRRQYELKN